jgi:hypothetical protein
MRIDDEDEDPIAEDPTPSQVSASGKPRRTSKSDEAKGKTGTTLQQLISRFEDQYEEMGHRYREMGNILKDMKMAIVRGRERTEEEIRMDLLSEVQKSIMKSLPKK